MRGKRYGLGRIPSAPDTRDWRASRLFGMIEMGDAVPVEWQCPVVLSQKGTQHCVGFAWAGFKAAAPGLDSTITDAEGHRIYYECKKLEDNLGGLENGAMLRSGAKVLQAEGVIDAYAWGNFAEANEWVRKYGPVLLGTNWYANMYRPDSKGVVTVGGDRIGGHAYIWLGDKQAPADNGLQNSWGKGWGKDGRFFMSDPTLYGLVEDGNGEAIMAVKILKPIPHWPDLPDMNEDDLKSQDACYQRWILKGYPNGLFSPGLNVTTHQVGTVMVRLGIKATNPWEELSDYTRPALRGWLHEQLPMLKMNDLDRPLEPTTRFALMLMVGRYLRGVK